MTLKRENSLTYAHFQAQRYFYYPDQPAAAIPQIPSSPPGHTSVERLQKVQKQQHLAKTTAQPPHSTFPAPIWFVLLLLRKNIDFPLADWLVLLVLLFQWTNDIHLLAEHFPNSPPPKAPAAAAARTRRERVWRTFRAGRQSGSYYYSSGWWPRRTFKGLAKVQVRTLPGHHHPPPPAAGWLVGSPRWIQCASVIPALQVEDVSPQQPSLVAAQQFIPTAVVGAKQVIEFCEFSNYCNKSANVVDSRLEPE